MPLNCSLSRRLLFGLSASAFASATFSPSDVSAADDAAPAWPIIDTNVNLFRWPGRRLPLDDTQALVGRLRELGVTEAWAGSFEGLLHRDLQQVNQRLVQACGTVTGLIPVGSINPTLPDWEYDLDRCLDVHHMSAIRLHPSYHGYGLNDPRLLKLLARSVAVRCLVQIAVSMEDVRTQHPLLQVSDVDLGPLPDLMAQVNGAHIQLLNYRPTAASLGKLSQLPQLYFDTARIEGTDGVSQLIQNLPAGRVMYGSHAPFLIPQAALIRVHESGQLDDSSLQAVLAGNAERITAGNNRPPGKSDLHLGLPLADQLKRYRIWDSYFTPAHAHPGADGSGQLIADIERSLPAIRKGHFEKLCYFAHVGLGTTTDRALESLLLSQPELVMRPLERFPDLLLGMLQLNPHNVPASMDALNRWLRDGPMLGVYFSGGGPAAMVCTDPSVAVLVERVAELGGVIMQHTWYKTGGKQSGGESTPAELAELANRYPQQQFLCAHAGGEWEQGIRAVRHVPNILVETSGFDATAGFIEMAVRELGPERIVFGSHLPSRSLGTELSKVLAADVSEDAKRMILGGNYRRLLARS